MNKEINQYQHRQKHGTLKEDNKSNFSDKCQNNQRSVNIWEKKLYRR